VREIDPSDVKSRSLSCGPAILALLISTWVRYRAGIRTATGYGKNLWTDSAPSGNTKSITKRETNIQIDNHCCDLALVSESFVYQSGPGREGAAGVLALSKPLPEGTSPEGVWGWGSCAPAGWHRPARVILNRANRARGCPASRMISGAPSGATPFHGVPESSKATREILLSAITVSFLLVGSCASSSSWQR
jgi:hypothetical protein